MSETKQWKMTEPWHVDRISEGIARSAEGEPLFWTDSNMDGRVVAVRRAVDAVNYVASLRAALSLPEGAALPSAEDVAEYMDRAHRIVQWHEGFTLTTGSLFLDGEIEALKALEARRLVGVRP